MGNVRPSTANCGVGATWTNCSSSKRSGKIFLDMEKPRVDARLRSWRSRRRGAVAGWRVRTSATLAKPLGSHCRAVRGASRSVGRRPAGRVAAVANLEPDAARVREVFVENARRRGVGLDLPKCAAWRTAGDAGDAGAAVVDLLRRQSVLPFGDGVHRLSSHRNRDRRLIMGIFSFSAQNARVR